jgi:UTP--glucose-1-phosphate uridylyltransferase
VPNASGTGVAGFVEKPIASKAPSNLAFTERYILTSYIFRTLWGLSAGSGGEIQLADVINIHAQQASVETVRLNGQCFDCGSARGFMAAPTHEFASRGFC